jgi:integrase
MEFAAPKSRIQKVEFQQASAFISKAHELGEHELAMAQALEFELMMRQTDVIGKWEDGKDLPNILQWVNGLRWEQITKDRILSYTMGKTKRTVPHDLNEYQLVRAELDRLPSMPDIGPIIIDHKTGRPFKYSEFARRWRNIARLAGIPDDVWNRDSRAGGVTEARDAGADKDDVREGAGHAQAQTTDIYVRNKIEQTRRVARARAALRKKQNRS